MVSQMEVEQVVDDGWTSNEAGRVSEKDHALDLDMAHELRLSFESIDGDAWYDHIVNFVVLIMAATLIFIALGGADTAYGVLGIALILIRLVFLVTTMTKRLSSLQMGTNIYLVQLHRDRLSVQNKD